MPDPNYRIRCCIPKTSCAGCWKWCAAWGPPKPESCMPARGGRRRTRQLFCNSTSFRRQPTTPGYHPRSARRCSRIGLRTKSALSWPPMLSAWASTSPMCASWPTSTRPIPWRPTTKKPAGPGAMGSTPSPCYWPARTTPMSCAAAPISLFHRLIQCGVCTKR